MLGQHGRPRRILSDVFSRSVVISSSLFSIFPLFGTFRDRPLSKRRITDNYIHVELSIKQQLKSNHCSVHHSWVGRSVGQQMRPALLYLSADLIP